MRESIANDDVTKTKARYEEGRKKRLNNHGGRGGGGDDDDEYMTSTARMHLSIYLPPHSQPADKASSSSYPSSKYAFFSRVTNNSIDFNKGKPPAPEVIHHSNNQPSIQPSIIGTITLEASTGRMIDEEEEEECLEVVCPRSNFHLGRKKGRKIGRNGSTPMAGEEEEVIMMMTT